MTFLFSPRRHNSLLCAAAGDGIFIDAISRPVELAL